MYDMDRCRKEKGNEKARERGMKRGSCGNGTGPVGSKEVAKGFGDARVLEQRLTRGVY